MIRPPIHSHSTIGLTCTPSVTRRVCGRRRDQREVDVTHEPGAHRRGADPAPEVREGRDRGRVRAEICRRRARAATRALTVVFWSLRSRSGPRYVTVKPRTVADSPRVELHLALRGVARRRGERDRDRHHTDVHEQPAVQPRVAAHHAHARDRNRFAMRAAARPHADRDRAPDARKRERRPVRTSAPGATPRAPSATRDDERDAAHPRRDQQSVAQHLTARRPPRKQRTDRHEEQQRDPDRRAHAFEVGLAHRQRAVLERFGEQREHRARQHDQRETGEQQVVEQERGFPRERRVDATRRAQRVTAPRDQTDTERR